MANFFSERKVEGWLRKNSVVVNGAAYFVTPTEELFEEAVVKVLQWNSLEDFHEEYCVEFDDVDGSAWLPGNHMVFIEDIPDESWP